MTPCDECARAMRDLAYRRFDPACLTCGGRYLWSVQRAQLPEKEKREWLRKVLADWMAHGHAEQQLRELARQDWKEWARGRDSRH